MLLAACGGDAVILEKICQAFRARLPDQLTAVQDALRERDTARLREAAHKLCGMVAAFSTVAGGVASDLEDHAAQGQLEEARPLVEQLETMAKELMRLAGGLSIETLRNQVVQRGPQANRHLRELEALGDSQDYSRGQARAEHGFDQCGLSAATRRSALAIPANAASSSKRSTVRGSTMNVAFCVIYDMRKRTLGRSMMAFFLSRKPRTSDERGSCEWLLPVAVSPLSDLDGPAGYLVGSRSVRAAAA